MDQIINFLSGFNVQTILSLFGIVWYFSRDIKACIINLDTDVREMNTRIARVEGTVYGADIYKKIKDKETGKNL
jgi:hypothetical protein